MARRRVWSFAQLAEVYLRSVEFHQTPTEIARAIPSLTYNQVYHFVRHENLVLSDKFTPAQLQLLDELREQVGEQLGEQIRIENADHLFYKLVIDTEPESEIEIDTELESEINDCVGMAKIIASQFKITPTKFLQLCLDTARNAR